MNVVIYARYSSHNQTEQSIEGQLEDCHRYAKDKGYTVIDEYIDRAKTATSDKRPDFQRMIADSKNKKFEAVLVWKQDRFARNRFDSATYKNKLKKNGVRVISVIENISEGAEGIIVESVLEGMAEYYSKNLSENVSRGMRLNAEKILSNGGSIPLGFKTVDKVYVIDEEKAPVVQEIFDRVINGDTYTEIADSLNERGIKTVKGGTFAKSSIPQILRNIKYTGTYKYGDIQIPNAIPRIIDDETFRRAQKMIERNKKAPSHKRASVKDEYLLTTKLFCGYCREMMVGMSGRSQTGDIHRYYECKGRINKTCHKKNVQKDYIENLVIDECKKLLTEKNIETISKEVERLSQQDYTSTHLYSLEQQLAKLEKDKQQLMDIVKEQESPELRKAFYSELEKVLQNIKDTESAIEAEKESGASVSADEVSFFLHQLKSDCSNSMKSKKALINTFVNSIYLYDDKLTIAFNSGDKDAIVTFTDSEESENPDETLISGVSSKIKIGAPPH